MALQPVTYLTSGPTTIVLPNPLPDDTQNNLISVNHRRTMNNLLFTYVKNSGLTRLVYKFQLFRMKALELQDFVAAYLLAPITIQDYRGNSWSATLTGDPFEYVMVARDGITEVTLTFEGVQQ